MTPSRDKDCQRYIDDPNYAWSGNQWRNLARQRARQRSENMTPEQIKARRARVRNATHEQLETKRQRMRKRRYLDQVSIRNADRTIAKYEALLKPPHQESA